MFTIANSSLFQYKEHLAHHAVTAAAAALFLGCLQPALGALPCGARPDIVSEHPTPQFAGDLMGTATLIYHAPPGPSLRGFVTAQRRELRHKYPEVEKPALDSYLVWATCQTIAKDANLPPAQGFDEYAQFYRLLTEPIDKAASKPE